MSFEILQIPVLNDNYVFLVHDHKSNKTAVIDPATYEDVAESLERHSWGLDYILNTHHHWDHIGGNLALKKRFGCKVIGSYADRARIPGIDETVKEGDIVNVGTISFEVIEVFGHTMGHIAYYSGFLKSLFCGDTIFSIGCGRLFEGQPLDLFNSLSKLAALPDETDIYCAHEYTLANIKFARTVDPANKDLADYEMVALELRSRGLATIPTKMLTQKRCNPFMRCSEKSLRSSLNIAEDLSEVQVFTHLRRMKDNF